MQYAYLKRLIEIVAYLVTGFSMVQALHNELEVIFSWVMCGSSQANNERHLEQRKHSNRLTRIHGSLDDR